MINYSQTQKKLVYTDVDPVPVFPEEHWDTRLVTSKKFKKEYKITGVMVSNGIVNYICVEQNLPGNVTKQTTVIPEKDLVYSTEVEKEYRNYDLLLVNEAPQSVVKDFLLKFWISFPQENIEIRREYEAKIKAGGKTSLPAVIVDEKKVGGKFVAKDDFVVRMTNRYNNFPWRQFSEMIEC